MAHHGLGHGIGERLLDDVKVAQRQVPNHRDLRPLPRLIRLLLRQPQPPRHVPNRYPLGRVPLRRRRRRPAEEPALLLGLGSALGLLLVEGTQHQGGGCELVILDVDVRQLALDQRPHEIQQPATTQTL